jgi:hypothetical protein
MSGVFMKLFCTLDWTNGTFHRFYRRVFWKIRCQENEVLIVLLACIDLILLQNENYRKAAFDFIAYEVKMGTSTISSNFVEQSKDFLSALVIWERDYLRS